MITQGAALTFLLLVFAPSPNLGPLSVSLDGDTLLVSAPKLPLIEGPILTRLKNGNSVAFDFHLALWTGARDNIRRRSFERFVVSYDLWEEKFAVEGLRKPRAHATRLAPDAVGPWCLKQISIPKVDFATDEALWVRLDVRAVDPRQDAELFDSNGVSVMNLIDILSRPARNAANRWTIESGALRASAIRR
jgi:hypothetical protein